MDGDMLIFVMGNCTGNKYVLIIILAVRIGRNKLNYEVESGIYWFR